MVMVRIEDAMDGHTTVGGVPPTSGDGGADGSS